MENVKVMEGWKVDAHYWKDTEINVNVIYVQVRPLQIMLTSIFLMA